MELQGPPVTCADCGADLSTRRIVVTMETGGDFLAGYDQRGKPRYASVPRGEAKLCAGCAGKGIRGEKLGLFEEQKPIAPRQ